MNRQAIFERDAYCCQYCGKKFKTHELNLDHVVPKERGGMLTWENIVTSCLVCNTAKANRTPREAGMHLMKKPRQPKSRPFVSYIIGQEMEDDWQHFLYSHQGDVEVEIMGGEKEAEEAVVG